MKIARLLPIAAAFLSFGFGQNTPVVPYASTMEDRVSIDGYVDREESEYPAQLKNPATGMTVSWGFDDSMIYVALETRGKGWLGIGFGSPSFVGSNMLVGFFSDDSDEMYNVVWKDSTQMTAVGADSLDLDWAIDFDDETGVTTLEAAYPLTWRGDGAPKTFAGTEMMKDAAILGLIPGDTCDVLLEQNTKSLSIRTKPTHRAQLKVKLAESPHVPAQPEGEK